ncbi:MAG: SecDF P1 head subdomain-containing protein, partial [Thermoguttaceae bacterium]
DLSRLIQLQQKLVGDGRSRSQMTFERIIYDLDERIGLQTIDLETGWSYDLPDGIWKWEPQRVRTWFEEHEVDVIANHEDNQWGLGFTVRGGILVPADDVSLDEAASRVSVVLEEKERLRGVTIRHDEPVVFWLLPEDSNPPLSFAFRTAEGTEGLLQIIEINSLSHRTPKPEGSPPIPQPKSLRLRWKVTKRAPVKQLTGSIAPHTIHLPDADTKDTSVVLDLASGEMLKLPWQGKDTSAAPQQTDQDTRHFTKLGKGDLAFDHQLFCLRGGTIELAAEDAGQKLNMTGKKDDAKAYQLPKLPCELLVTTPEKWQFVVKILDETPAGGLNLEYRQVKGTAKQQADSTEPQPDAGPPNLEGSLQEADVQMAPECGVLDFRIAANEEEGKTFAETGKALGWYDASPWMNDTAGLVTRLAEGRTQILLWQTPEKSLTASQPDEKKWHIVEVSVIAELDRPARLGVVFDVEGGRRLRELTTANIDRRMAVVVDENVVGCPIVRSAIGERVEIAGSFSKAELARLSTALQAGMEAKQP